MPAQRAPANHGHRRPGVQAVGLKGGSDFADALDAHQEHFCAGLAGDAFPVQGALFLVGILVACDDREARAMITVGQRNAGVTRRGHDGRDARYHLERHTVTVQPSRFLAAPAENVRVAALESHHRLAGPCLLGEQPV